MDNSRIEILPLKESRPFGEPPHPRRFGEAIRTNLAVVSIRAIVIWQFVISKEGPPSITNFLRLFLDKRSKKRVTKSLPPIGIHL
jgi:hypothetical protein